MLIFLIVWTCLVVFKQQIIILMQEDSVESKIFESIIIRWIIKNTFCLYNDCKLRQNTTAYKRLKWGIVLIIYNWSNFKSSSFNKTKEKLK